MTEGIIVVGAGGFGRETLDVVEAAVADGADYRLLGVVDANPRAADLARLGDRGVRYVGTVEEWAATAVSGTRFIVAIGDPASREKVTGQMLSQGALPISVVHPAAVIGSQLKLGSGVVICGGVQVSTNVTLGDHAHLNPGSIVGHDVALEAYVSVNPGAIVSGNVTVRRRALLGAGSIVLQGLTVGVDATVGAAACVTKDVDAGAIVVGIPARPREGSKAL